MKTIKEIVSNEWYKITDSPFEDSPYEYKILVLNAVKEASEQAFNAGRETTVYGDRSDYWLGFKYLLVQDYINQIDK